MDYTPLQLLPLAQHTCQTSVIDLGSHSQPDSINQASLGSAKFGPENHFNLSLQERALLVRRPPYYVPIDPEVGMRQNVMKRDDSRPRHVRVGGFQLIGHESRRLAYHSEFLYDRTADQFRRLKFRNDRVLLRIARYIRMPRQ